MSKIHLERFYQICGLVKTAIGYSADAREPHDQIDRIGRTIKVRTTPARLEKHFLRKTAWAVAVVTMFFWSHSTAFAGEMGAQLTNDDIVKMVQNRIGPNVIIDRISDANQNFDLSTDAVIRMKEKGVPDEILAAMLVSSARAPAGTIPTRPGNLPARSVTGANLMPPNLSGTGSQGFPGMESLDLPGLSGADSLDGGVPGLPALPALPALSALPSIPEATGAGSPAASPVALTPPTPIPTAGVQTQSQGFSLPPIDDVSVESDFYSMPAGTASGDSASATASAGRAGDDGYEEAKARFQKEIVNVMSEAPEKQSSAVAWMLANQDLTLDFLRETMIKAQRPEFEAAAVFSLGRMRDVEAVPEIRRRLVNRNRVVRERAAEALAYIEDNDAIAAAEKGLSQRVEPMDGLIRLVGYARLVRASDSLGKILADSSVPANRVAAAWALAQLGRSGVAAWPAMKKALASDSSPDVRREAARAVSSYHDDKESLKLLETACRRDPEVRKVVLEELANYRESIPFLVSIVNLNPDQIAADELETARSTLFKLTGEDFNLDGPRWKRWFTDNRSRLGLPLPPGEAAGDGKIPPGMKKGPAHLAAGRPRQVDVRSWGIVADPSEIPLAPEVDDSLPAAHASVGAPQTGRLPVPPPAGLAGGAGRLRGPAGLSGMPGVGGGGMAGMTPPPGAGYGGGYDDDDDGYGPSGGALSGMRLPLPSGLMGAGGGEDAPPIPVGMGARGSSSGSFGMGGMSSGTGGDAPGLSMPGSGLSGMPGGSSGAFETPDSSFSGGGYSDGYESGVPSSPSYESSTSYYGDSGGDTYGSGYSSGYDGYGSSVDVYQAGSQIVLPPTEYAPISVDAYTTSDVIEDEVAASRVESTGELVPNVPYERVTTLRDLGIPDEYEWTSSIGVGEGSVSPVDAGFSEAREVDGDFDAGSAFGEDGVDAPEFTRTFSGGQVSMPGPSGLQPSVTAIAAPVDTAAPGASSALVPEGANVIAFPGDQSTFGLGEPMFNEYGQPSSVEASELPPVQPIVLPAASQPQSSSQVVTETVVEQSGMPEGAVLSLPREAMEELGVEARMLLPTDGVYEGVSAGFDGYADSNSLDYDFDTMGEAVVEGRELETGGYTAPVQGPMDYSRGYARAEMFDEDGAFDDDGYQTASGYDDGFDDEDDDEGEGFAGEGYVVEARELPLPGGSGSSAAVVTGAPVVKTAPVESGTASPPASSLHLPSRRRRKQPTESAIVSHSVNAVAPVAPVATGGMTSLPGIQGVQTKGAVELQKQAIRTGESAVLSGPSRILDEDGRTVAIVINRDDELLPPEPDETDMYIQLDEPGFGGFGGGVVEAREVPAPPVRREVGGAAEGGTSVETSPSQMPGRNFRQKK